MKQFYSILFCIMIVFLFVKQDSVFGESGRVLIVSSESTFKDAVQKRIVEHLTRHKVSVTIIALAELTKYSEADYTSVVIMNECWAGRLNKHVRSFLKRVADNDKVILLTTAGDENWRPKHVEVDAITTASRIQDADSVAKTIVNKVRQRIQ